MSWANVTANLLMEDTQMHILPHCTPGYMRCSFLWPVYTCSEYIYMVFVEQAVYRLCVMPPDHKHVYGVCVRGVCTRRISVL